MEGGIYIPRGVDVAAIDTRLDDLETFEASVPGTYAQVAQTVSDFTAPKMPTFERFASNPVFQQSDTDFATIYWPWIVRVDGLLEAPIDTFYLWYSTDHDAGTGGIGLATAPAVTGPWTDYGEVYVDTTAGDQTETPSVLWNESGHFEMYYQQNGVGVGVQSTLRATSPDGVTWTRQGIALQVPSATEYPGDGHTGYFRPFRIGTLWLGYSLNGGGTFPHSSLWHSSDGATWVCDPRPLGSNVDIVGSKDYQVGWPQGSIVRWRGQNWWIGSRSNYAAGATPSNRRVSIAPIAANFRQLAAPPVVIIEPAGWEADDLRSVQAFVDEGRIHIVYQMSDKVGIATSEVE